MTRSSRPTERGVILPLVLFALAVLGALLGTLLTAAQMERAGGDAGLYASQAFAAAESGTVIRMAAGRGGSVDSLPPGATFGYPSESLGEGIYHTDSLTRIGGPIYLLRVAGERRNGEGRTLARFEQGVLVRAKGANFGALSERSWGAIP
jgi:hypothetical protein